MVKVDQDISDFSTEQLKREITILKRENHAALATIEKLLTDLSKKTEEINHLQNLVSQAVPVMRAVPDKLVTRVAPEEEIAVMQLERLRQASQSRTLTLEETRMYDLLVKNKRLSQDESTINLSKAHYRNVDDNELLQIASKGTVSSDDPDA